MILKTFIVIEPISVDAGQNIGSKGWRIRGAYESSVPDPLPTLSRVYRLSLDIPDSEFNSIKTIHASVVAAPDPKVLAEAVAELEDWTA